MKKAGLIRHFYFGNGKEHSFTANVILNGCSNPTKKLKGLYKVKTFGYDKNEVREYVNNQIPKLRR